MTPGGSWRMSPDSRRRDPLPRGWKNIRAAILERDGHQCTWMIGPIRCPGRIHLEVDHIGDPQDNDPANLRTLCKRHHASKTAGDANAVRWQMRRATTIKPHPGIL